MTIEDMEMLVVDMILEKRLDAQIDQINGFVEMGEMNVKSNLKARKMEALVKWADAIENYRESFYQKLSVWLFIYHYYGRHILQAVYVKVKLAI